MFYPSSFPLSLYSHFSVGSLIPNSVWVSSFFRSTFPNLEGSFLGTCAFPSSLTDSRPDNRTDIPTRIEFPPHKTLSWPYPHPPPTELYPWHYTPTDKRNPIKTVKFLQNNTMLHGLILYNPSTLLSEVTFVVLPFLFSIRNAHHARPFGSPRFLRWHARNKSLVPSVRRKKARWSECTRGLAAILMFYPCPHILYGILFSCILRSNLHTSRYKLYI